MRRGLLIAYILSNTSNAEGMGSVRLVELVDKLASPDMTLHHWQLGSNIRLDIQPQWQGQRFTPPCSATVSRSKPNRFRDLDLLST
jgi:hypothetical protein